MMESLHEEKTKNGTFLNIKVIKYYSKEKEESEVAKPRFSFNRNSVQRIINKSPKNVLSLHLVEPCIEIDSPIVRQQKWLTKSPQQQKINSPQNNKPKQQSKQFDYSLQKLTYKQQLNRQVLLRLGLLSRQAKRQMEIEKLQARALKLRNDQIKESIISNKELALVVKEIKKAESPSPFQCRCTTSASAASRLAQNYQDDKIIELISCDRGDLMTNKIKQRNKNSTIHTKTQINDFYKTIMGVQNVVKEDIKLEQTQVSEHLGALKQQLLLYKRKLQNYDDELEIALTDDIKLSVIKFSHSKQPSWFSN